MAATENLEAKAGEITSPRFIERVVWPALAERFPEAPSPADCKTAIILDRGTGRLTVSYRFPEELLLFGKLYSNQLGAYGAGVLGALWNSGFGRDQPHQVSEPVAFLPEHNLLLTRAAEGTCMLSFLGRDDEVVLSHVRRAAEWLVHLHRSPLRLGNQESLWDSLKLHRILRRLSKAAARAPHERERLMGLVERLCEKGTDGGREIIALTHGRYHSEHIFVSDTAITLIDLDRACLSDPAKDLAEFLSVLRHRTFKQTGSVATAEGPTRVFLESYLSRFPENAESLAVHWGASLLMNMLHYVKKRDSEEPTVYSEKIQFYLEEYDKVMHDPWLP